MRDEMNFYILYMSVELNLLAACITLALKL